MTLADQGLWTRIIMFYAQNGSLSADPKLLARQLRVKETVINNWLKRWGRLTPVVSSGGAPEQLLGGSGDSPEKLRSSSEASPETLLSKNRIIPSYDNLRELSLKFEESKFGAKSQRDRPNRPKTQKLDPGVVLPNNKNKNETATLPAVATPASASPLKVEDSPADSSPLPFL